MQRLRIAIGEINRILSDRTESVEEIEKKVKQVLTGYFQTVPALEEFFDKCDSLFAQSEKNYIYFLSLCFWAMREKAFLDKISECIFCEGISWDYTMAMKQQLDSTRFRHSGMDSTYKEKRVQQKELTRRLYTALGKEQQHIPYRDRKKGRILLATDTLLSDRHAPTQIVFEVARALQEVWGYEIMIGVHVVKTPSDIDEIWYHPIEASYNSKLNYISKVTYCGKEYDVCQQIVDKRHLRGVLRYIDMVREYNPEFIWHIGAVSTLTEILAELTTVVMMPCTQGYGASDAQVLVAYLTSDKKKLKEMEDYICREKQKSVTMKMRLPVRETETVFLPQDFGFEEGDFLIAIVGNRLNGEINEEFIQVMLRIAGLGSDIRFVTVGNCTIDWKRYGLDHIVCDYGYCYDLLGLLRGVDLFLNPKRQGGAGGAADAIYVGTPLCTLPACDVADHGEAFVCQDYDGMVEMVKRYYEDEDFYAFQVEQCRILQEACNQRSFPDNCNSVVHQVQEWLENGDIQ